MAIIFRLQAAAAGKATINSATGAIQYAAGLTEGNYNIGKVEQYNDITDVVLAATANDIVLEVAPPEHDFTGITIPQGTARIKFDLTPVVYTGHGDTTNVGGICETLYTGARTLEYIYGYSSNTGYFSGKLKFVGAVEQVYDNVATNTYTSPHVTHEGTVTNLNTSQVSNLQSTASSQSGIFFSRSAAGQLSFHLKFSSGLSTACLGGFIVEFFYKDRAATGYLTGTGPWVLSADASTAADDSVTVNGFVEELL